MPLPVFLRDDLSEYRETRPHELTDPVFSSPEGEPLRHNNFCRRHFKPAVHRAGLPGELRFDDLGHTFAGLLIAQGAHPRAIMERMGHSSIQVTLGTYGHLLPGIDERLTGDLDDVGRSARRAISGASSVVPEVISESSGSRLGHAEIVPLFGRERG